MATDTFKPISLESLTTTTLDGTGVYDVLMRANKAHLDAEFGKNRIKGAEYATVYLGSLQSVLTASITFLLQKDKNDLEVQLLKIQLLLANKQLEKTQQELDLLTAKTNTEKAQISDTVNGVVVTGITGTQKALYEAQSNGFKRDAEQKAAKLLIDTWTIRRTTNDATLVSDRDIAIGDSIGDGNVAVFATKANFLGDQSIGKAVTKLLAGVGITN